MSTIEQTEPASRILNELNGCVAAFVQAWDSVPTHDPSAEPPSIARHLDRHSGRVYRLALVELVKVDLERRWPHPILRRRLEEYAVEFPELCDELGPPPDLMFEECRVRRDSGEQVDAEEYVARFPAHAAVLRELLAAERPGVTTSLAAIPKIDDYQAGQQVDDFELLAPLGKGAFGSVFLAKQKTMSRLVALKISANHGFESQTLAQLDHPYIVRVYDQRQLAERRVQLMYMQYVPGGTLEGLVNLVRRTAPAMRSGKLIVECVDEHLESQGEPIPGERRLPQYLSRLSWPQAVCWLGARLAEALEHAHARGVLHRDLKPANILMAADCTPKLADFNVSCCSLVPGATAAAYFGGSLPYMSPEQLDIFRGTSRGGPESVDARSDLFSLAIVIWELLTGYRPFAGERPLEPGLEAITAAARRRRQGLSDEDLRRIPPDCPRGLLHVLRTCLAGEPENRIQSATALRRQLDLCLRPEAQDLLVPRRHKIAAALRSYALVPLVVLGILPNAGLSALNIPYNIREILNQLRDPEVSKLFWLEVWTINPVCYLVGVSLVIGYCWPAVRAMRRVGRSGREPDPQAARDRVRSTRLGDCVAIVSGVEWMISAVVFPLWLYLGLGEKALSREQFIHFFASQALCGILAASMAFFMITLFSLRVITPALVNLDRDDEPLYRALDRLTGRMPRYLFMTFAVMPLAVIVAGSVQTGSRGPFVALGVLGLAAAGAAQYLSRRIGQAALALERAVSVESGPSELADSSRLTR